MEVTCDFVQTGIVTASAAGSPSVIVTSNSTDTFAAADLTKTQNAVPPRWQANAAWAMGLATINTAAFFETASGALVYPELRENPL